MTLQARQPSDQSGFSLVEVLVVMLVIGLISSVVLLNGGPAGPNLAQEADRFAARLAEARDLALIRNRPVLVEVTPDGYTLRQQSDAGWAPAGRDDARFWEDGATIDAGGRRLPLAIVFDPTGMSEAIDLTLYRNGGSETVELDGAGGVRRMGGRDG